jgi:LmbE family N-acetylglucosaminyl deacetylase
MNKKTFLRHWALLLSFLMLCLLACGPGENQVSKNRKDASVCAVLAHPDDETMISGTLAMLADRGFDITVVYVTSGDDGPDETGKGLYGNALGAEREKEALQALLAIGIKNPPVFLRFPDSQVPEYVESVEQSLYDLFNETKPEVVIGFGPDGITDAWDHKMSGFATDVAFDLTDAGRLLLHIANSKSFSPIYPTGIDVSKHAVNIGVDVSKYTNQRTAAYGAHHTQFNRANRLMYKALVHTMPTEEFIIARNRDAGQWLEECFDVTGRKYEREGQQPADSASTTFE